jgi:hypothetical protein
MIFHETINSEHYVSLILSLFDQLTDEKKSYLCFMQVIAMAHSTNNSVDALYGVFGKQVINQ